MNFAVRSQSQIRTPRAPSPGNAGGLAAGSINAASHAATFPNEKPLPRPSQVTDHSAISPTVSRLCTRQFRSPKVPRPALSLHAPAPQTDFAVRSQSQIRTLEAQPPKYSIGTRNSVQPATIKRVPGVYLSYPFCAQKCTYCNFASGVFPRSLEARYLNALAAEVRAHAWQWRPETVFLGGGTPSQIAPLALQSLLSTIPGQPWLEATLEAAPGTVTSEKARAWADCGIGRVSLGVQSFVELELRRSGRKHTAQTVAADIQTLAESGIGNYNIDLIAGLSGQTEASWRESLEWVERLHPPHVSVYMLEVDEDSRLGSEMLRGGARYGANDAPDDDQTAAFYEMAVERLAAMGIARYEISNFARPGFESRHNLKYWKLEPYVGFGADAHSFDGRMRSQNPPSLDEYMVGHASPCQPAEGLGLFRPAAIEAALAEERFFVGLRLTEGIRPQPEEWRRFAEPIQRFITAGLLETAGGVLRLTNRGIMLSNEVFQEFLPA
jgi:oxygen-independent coproporphyrinogen-3 oxidase